MSENQPECPECFTIKDAYAVRQRFLALGLFNVLLGVLVIIFPMLNPNYQLAGVIGVALMCAGLADAWHAMLLVSKFGYILSWISSVLLFVAGLILLMHTVSDITSIHLALSLIFVISGVLRMGKGLDIRPVNSWPWVIASGMICVLFGLIILHQGEDISVELFQLFVAISLTVDGWSRMIVFWVHEN